MQLTLTQSGLFAFDGIHVCDLQAGTSLSLHSRIAKHGVPETVLLTEEHLQALFQSNWGSLEQTLTVTEADAHPFGPLPELTEANADEEKVSDPIEEKQEEPAAENKAINPVIETKPAFVAETKKPAGKKKR